MSICRSSRTIVLGFLFFLPGAAVVWAQLPSNGQVTGTVMDATGAAVAGADVSLIDRATSASQRSKTNSSGNFVFNAVVPGTYDITADASGFQRAVVQNVLVLVGKTTDQHVKLAITGSKQVVEVSGADPTGIWLTESRDANL